MTRTSPDKLWPVLCGLIALLAGALAMEEYAALRGNEPIRIEIRREATAAFDDDDERVSEGDPETTATIGPGHAEARSAARRGELDRALALYRREIERSAGAIELRVELGFWLLVAGDVAAATAELASLKSVAPDSSKVAFTYGLALRRSGDSRGAERELRRALGIEPSHGAARFALGRLLLKTRRPAEAIEVLEPATKTGGNAERARALVTLGRAALSTGDASRAERAFTAAIEWAPAQAELRVGIARAYIDRGADEDLRRAEVILSQAAELAPDLPQVHSALGKAREGLGQADAARQAYERALRLDPDLRFARIRLLRLALARQDHGAARVMAQALIERDPAVPEHHFLAGLTAAKAGRAEEARSHYQRAIERADGRYPEAYFNLGILEKKEHRVEAAIIAYNKALEQRPDYLSALNNLALVYGAAGRPEEAEALLRDAVARDPRYAGAWMNLGELLADQKRYPEAIEALRRAIEVKPDYAEARLDLGVALARSGDHAAAIATYRALLADQPRYAVAAYNLALALDSSGRSQDAETELRKVLEIDPEHVGALGKLAALESKAGRLDEARKLAEDLLERQPKDLSARLLLAELLQKQGEAGACAREVRVALADSPGDERARRLESVCSSASRTAKEVKQ